MTSDSSDERLRRLFQAGGEQPGPENDCPDPERLLAAAARELPPAERRLVVDHTSRCAACAEDFRIAAAMLRAAPAATSSGGKLVAFPGGAPGWRSIAGTLAAMLFLGLLVAGLWRHFGSGGEVYRGGEEQIVSLLGEDPALRRSAAVLRWQGPAGARYALFVTTAELALVDQAADLETPSYRLPPGKLEGLPAGARLDWRVEALLPDGRRLASPTFGFRLAE